MIITIKDLTDLENILESLVFEDEILPNILDEKNSLDLIESALYLMEDYINENPTAISEPGFECEMLEDVKELFYIQFENEILEYNWLEDDLDELLEEAHKIFITTFYPERSIANNNNHTNFEKSENNQIDNNDKIKKLLLIIDHIKQKPQPQQRTDEWYSFRHNLITASNAYKCFESQSTINQLIYEKCQPLKRLDDDKGMMVNINTPFHWGQKYEPVSVMIYEYLYNTKVDDFGCVKHDHYPFLGASPDGINIDMHSERFGRMLEIKNIVNREINGIPKKEYWVQMQLQMEVCNLDECDFLETKFVEYETANQFFKDFETENDANAANAANAANDANDTTTTNLHKKGVIIYFHNTVGAKPFYVYKPLDIVKTEDILKWEEEIIDKYQTNHNNMIYIKSIYWKLEKLSCVLVLRNKTWFNNNIQAIENVWNIIEKERVTGYEHRAPVKKIRKNSLGSSSDIESTGCLIKINHG